MSVKVRHQFLRVLLTLCLLVGGFALSAARAQDAAPPSEATGDDSPVAALQTQIESLREQLTSLREQLTAATDLEPDVRTQIEEQLQTAATSLTEAEEGLTDALDFIERSSQVQEERDELQSSMDDLSERGPPVVPEAAMLPQLEQTAGELQQTLDELTHGVRPPDDPQARAARRKVLRDLLVSLPQEITTLSQPPPVPEGEPPLLTQARQLATQCRKLRAEAMLLALRAELSLYDSEDAFNVAQLRRDVLGLQINGTEAELDAYQQQIRQRRQDFANERVRMARYALSPPDGPPPPQLVRNIIEGPLTLDDELLQGSLELALEEDKIRNDRELLMRQLETVHQELQQVRTWLEQAETRVETTGLTQALGQRLRQQREQLLDPLQVRQRKDQRQEAIEAAQNSFLDYTEQLNAWTDVEAVVDAILASSDTPRAETTRAELRNAVLQAVEQRKAFLTGLVAAYVDYTTTLDDLDVAESALIDEIEQFTEFIDMRILWIRSHDPLSLDSFRDDKLTLLWLLHGAVIPDIWQVIVTDVRRHYVLWGAVLVLFAALLIRGSAMRNRLSELAVVAEDPATTAMTPTLTASLTSIAISLPWPALLLFSAWRLHAGSNSAVVATLADGMFALGLACAVLEFFRQVCRPDGLAAAHFHWLDPAVALLRRTFRGLILVVLPAGALVVVLQAHNSAPGHDTAVFERLVFLTTMLILLLLNHRLLKPSAGILGPLVADQPHVRRWRLTYVAYAAGIGMVLLLIVLTIAGYYYTAQHLFELTWITACLTLVLVFVRAVLFRWLTLRRRRLAIATAESQAEPGSMSRQTQMLLNSTLCVVGLAALWTVWCDVFPAVNYLNQWTAWTHAATEIVPRTLLNGDTELVRQTVIVPITGIDLAAVILLAALTLAAARYAPGLLENSVLKRFSVSPSTSYATTTLLRWLIVLLGLILVGGRIGVDWGQAPLLIIFELAFVWAVLYGLHRWRLAREETRRGKREANRESEGQGLSSVAGWDAETVLPRKQPGEQEAAGPASLPAQFGRYRVIRPLGSGAMGAVYLAEDLQLERQVALKTPTFRSSDELLERFYREAKAVAALRHSHICPVFDVGEIDDRHFISMAYIEGRTLSDCIRSKTLWTEQQALTVVHKLALALQHAHDHGILHRDLKPGNVMIDSKGEPILMDFGLARKMTGDEEVRLTQTGMIVGSPAYMSPEQVQGDPENIGPASDQYGLGVILYELLTGRLPFHGTISGLIGQTLTREPPPPAELRPGLDPRIDAVCRKMMAKQPDERFPSVQALADELERILNHPVPSSVRSTAPEGVVLTENPATDDGVEASTGMSSRMVESE